MISQIISTELHPHTLHPDSDQLLQALEKGMVITIPKLPFDLAEQEQIMLNPQHAQAGRKNISLAPGSKQLNGIAPDSVAHAVLQPLVSRYAQASRNWLTLLFPEYRDRLKAAPTSLRLHQAQNRATSWRHDDSRLHIDAFPSRPIHGERILRVFMNINPHGEPRVWRVGEPFSLLAQHFLPRLPHQWPGSAWLRHTLGITKRRRSPYDHLMLSLHDAMKADLAYQQHCQQESLAFAPGAGWICFSDQTSHAVMSGQFLLEQTFFLAPEDMVNPQEAPLSTLEQLTRRVLI